MSTKKPFSYYLFSFFLILSFTLASLQLNVTPVLALPDCIWQGINPSWTFLPNWSCALIPSADHDVYIVDTANDPIIPQSSAITVKTLTIENDAQLTINNYCGIQANTLAINSGGSVAIVGEFTAFELTDQFINNGSLTINGGTTINHPPTDDGIHVTNTGTITLTGTDQAQFSILEPFTNTGTVDIQAGNLILSRSVTNHGVIEGASGTFMTFGSDWSENTFLFESGSTLEAEYLNIKGGTFDLYGSFIAPLEGSYLFLDGSDFGVEMIVRSSATVTFPKQVTIFSSSPPYKNTLTLENNAPEEHHIQELRLQGDSEIINAGYLRIMNELRWSGGTISGNGTTKIENGALFSIHLPVTHTLDQQAMINATTAQWDGGSLMLSNGANFENQVIFNANATTTLSGTGGSNFTNSGVFSKRTEGTTTTIDLPFDGIGEVEVMAGSLIFNTALLAPSGRTIDLGGGTLQLTNPLLIEEGASLIGTGNLDASLMNAGLISPGHSAGIVSIEGDFEQVSSGSLQMELFGAQTGVEYDQLMIEGIATLAGSLDISLEDDYVPSGAPSFTLMNYASRVGEFEQVNLTLPVGMSYALEYGDTALTLTISGLGNISGMITCSGSISTSSSPVYVNLFAGSSNPPPVEEIVISCGESYQFEGLPAGIYFLNAFLDLNDSGGGPPDENEPLAWYGVPDALDFVSSWDLTDIDIVLVSNNYQLFLPIVLR